MHQSAHSEMRRLLLGVACAIVACAAVFARDVSGDQAIERFLAHPSELHTYEAVRHLEASSLGHRGWIDAKTRYAPGDGFSYEVTATGGSQFIDNHVLRPILQREKEMIQTGDTSKSALDRSNYEFGEGAAQDGFATILMRPKRREETLIDGSILVAPDSGHIVRLQGKLAKNPSFWVKRADVVRSYAIVGDANVPVRLETVADLRLFGKAVLTMTYDYSTVDGQNVTH